MIWNVHKKCLEIDGVQRFITTVKAINLQIKVAPIRFFWNSKHCGKRQHKSQVAKNC